MEIRLNARYMNHIDATIPASRMVTHFTLKVNTLYHIFVNISSFQSVFAATWPLHCRNNGLIPSCPS